MRVAIKVNFGIPGYVDGQVVRVEADSEGTPLDSTWRRRLRAGDKSCEIVKPLKNSPKRAARREFESEAEGPGPPKE